MAKGTFGFIRNDQPKQAPERKAPKISHGHLGAMSGAGRHQGGTRGQRDRAGARRAAIADARY